MNCAWDLGTIETLQVSGGLQLRIIEGASHHARSAGTPRHSRYSAALQATVEVIWHRRATIEVIRRRKTTIEIKRHRKAVI